MADCDLVRAESADCTDSPPRLLRPFNPTAPHVAVGRLEPAREAGVVHQWRQGKALAQTGAQSGDKHVEPVNPNNSHVADSRRPSPSSSQHENVPMSLCQVIRKQLHVTWYASERRRVIAKYQNRFTFAHARLLSRLSPKPNDVPRHNMVSCTFFRHKNKFGHTLTNCSSEGTHQLFGRSHGHRVWIELQLGEASGQKHLTQA